LFPILGFAILDPENHIVHGFDFPKQFPVMKNQPFHLLPKQEEIAINSGEIK